MPRQNTPPCRAPAPAGHSARRLIMRAMRQALGLFLAGIAVMLGALALRSLPLAGQLWNRPESARVSLQPALTAAEKPSADLAFKCC
jgi:hypothetical protein